MNNKWNTLTFTQKQATVLSWIFVTVGLVLVYLNVSHIVRVRHEIIMLTVGLVDLCQAYVLWNSNRRVAVPMLCLAAVMIPIAILFCFI